MAANPNISSAKNKLAHGIAKSGNKHVSEAVRLSELRHRHKVAPDKVLQNNPRANQMYHSSGVTTKNHCRAGNKGKSRVRPSAQIFL